MEFRRHHRPVTRPRPRSDLEPAQSPAHGGHRRRRRRRRRRGRGGGGRPGVGPRPDDFGLNITSNPHAGRTGTDYTGPTWRRASPSSPGPRRPTTTRSSTTTSPAPAPRFIGIANSGGPQAIGVIGWSKQPLGTGVIGFTGNAGAYGGEFFGGLAEVRLRPGGAAPITLTNAHKAGELYEDETGTLWLCVARRHARNVAGARQPHRRAAAFHAISPKRVYDSRTAAGGQAGRPARTAPSRSPRRARTEVVPTGATAVAMTFTVTDTEGNGGFVAVRPAGTPYEGTSSINWFGPGTEPGHHGDLGPRRRPPAQPLGGRGADARRRRHHGLLPVAAPQPRRDRGGGWGGPARRRPRRSRAAPRSPPSRPPTTTWRPMRAPGSTTVP